MTSGWEVAAVVGPLVLSFLAIMISGVVSASPAATTFFQRWTRYVLTYAFPGRGRCHVLSWDDIRKAPAELIHGCHSSCQHVNPQAAEPHSPANCWNDSIGKVFNQLFSPNDTVLSSGGRTTTKPYQLPLFQDFVQTDIQTLKAFLLLSVESKRTCEIVDVKSMLDIRMFDDVATIHLKAPPLAPNNTKLTKFEVERIIEGYPPFYRSTILTPGLESYQLETQTRRFDHVSRGAWVLAVGLSTNIGPVPSLYNMQQLRENNESTYWKGTYVMSAFKMVLLTFSQLRDLWSDDALNWYSVWCDHALSCHNLIMSPSYSLKPWILKTQELESQALFRPMIGECACTRTCLDGDQHSKMCGRGQHIRKDAAKRLSADQCKAALEIFNNYHYSEDNLKIIRPVIAEILQTAILGMSEVEHYFSKRGQKLNFPELLKEKRHIYLRTCAGDGE